MSANPRIMRTAGMAAFLCLSIAMVARTQTSSAETSPDSTVNASPSPAANAPPTGPASLLQKGVTGELLALIVPRSEMELQRLLNEANGLVELAALEGKSNKDLAVEAEGRANVMASEMDVTKTKRDAAKKAKDQAVAADLDAAYKRQEVEYKYLVRVRDAMRADADRLASAQSAATAQAKAIEQEMQLVRKQAQIGATPSAQDVAEFRSMLRGVLESQRDAATKAREASDKRVRVVEDRLKQLDALAKLGQ